MLNIGVDFGVRRIAVSCADQGHFTALSYDFKKADRGMELAYLVDRFKWLTNGARVIGGTHLWIEGAVAAGAKNLQTMVALAATQGAIMGAHGPPVTIVPPGSWKKGTCGNGSATKEEVAAWLIKDHLELYMICSSQDEIDAMCMSLYGIGVTSGEILVPLKTPRKRKKVK